MWYGRWFTTLEDNVVTTSRKIHTNSSPKHYTSTLPQQKRNRCNNVLAMFFQDVAGTLTYIIETLQERQLTTYCDVVRRLILDVVWTLAYNVRDNVVTTSRRDHTNSLPQRYTSTLPQQKRNVETTFSQRFLVLGKLFNAIPLIENHEN